MRLEVFVGDITKRPADAIVNAANETLLGGGGVDGAIHRAAGPELMDACRALDGCATGDAKWTDGFKLPARYVIHAVGPIYRGGSNGEDSLLRSCYQRCLEVAESLEVASMTFPAISTGAYGYPRDLAARIAYEAAARFPAKHVQQVTFVCFDQVTAGTYQRLLSRE